MTPILFDRGQRFPNVNNGYGMLTECIMCQVTEEVNGTYECVFDYPTTGEHFSRLMTGVYSVGIVHDHNGDIQLFDVYRYSAKTDGIVTFYGSHVSYRLSNYICKGVSDSGSINSMPNMASILTSLTIGLVAETPEIYFASENHSTITTVSPPFVAPMRCNTREMLLSKQDLGFFRAGGNDYQAKSVLQRFGGEFVFDNFTVKYYDNRGTDNGVQIRYGKNLTEVDRDFDVGGIISRVFPVWVDSNNQWVSYDPVTSPHLYGNTADWSISVSPNPNADYPLEYINGELYEFDVPIVNSAVYNLTDQFQAQPTAEEARNAALDYMSKNSTWRPNDNITVQFADLYASPDYENIKALEKCAVGDLVSVYYADLGIVAEGVEIMSGTYDVLAEQFISMQLNTIRTTLAQLIIGETK